MDMHFPSLMRWRENPSRLPLGSATPIDPLKTRVGQRQRLKTSRRGDFEDDIAKRWVGGRTRDTSHWGRRDRTVSQRQTKETAAGPSTGHSFDLTNSILLGTPSWQYLKVFIYHHQRFSRLKGSIYSLGIYRSSFDFQKKKLIKKKRWRRCWE